MAIIKDKKNQWLFEGWVPYDVSEIEIATKVKEKLYWGKSFFQKIDIYDTYTYGRVLVLDKVIQTAEKDEFIYHEMLCQAPLFLHKAPKKVLIIGGGDGGSLREVLKHKIENVSLVEIDKKVIELCKKYLPKISKGAFQNKKTQIIIEDGKKYVAKYKDFFDIIIIDLSDPGGPSEDLISLPFYKKVKRALKRDGIISLQSGSFTYQTRLVKKIFNRIKKLFPYLEIRRAVIPSYQDGEYSFIVASKINLNKISFKDIEKKHKKLKLDLKYYYPEMHFASKVLPKYLKTIFIK